MAGDRRPVACRIRAYALAAPLGSTRRLKRGRISACRCRPHRFGGDIQTGVG